MASTFIQKGNIRRRTAAMSRARAEACASMMRADKNGSFTDIQVIPAGGGKARVEWIPGKAATLAKHFNQKQGERAERVDDVKRYRWRRIGRRAWHCQGPLSHQHYSIFLDRVGNTDPHCTCPDWPTISSVGGKCKHFICAEEAEERYQRDHPAETPKPEPALPVVRELDDPFQTLPQGRAS